MKRAYGAEVENIATQPNVPLASDVKLVYNVLFTYIDSSSFFFRFKSNTPSMKNI